MDARNEPTLEAEERLLEILRRAAPVCVAFSGGLDSSYLLWAARRADPRVTAVQALSPAVPAWDRSHARDLAANLGVDLRTVASRELETESYARNDALRCYHCKAELGRILRDLAGAAGEGTLVYGAVTDDLGDYRPGMEAAREAGIRAPLIEAGLSKAQVRHLSRRAGLPGWDRPASPCLASRIPYGIRVTPERLARVERAEEALRRLGLRVVRVRHGEETARVELGPEDLERVLEEGLEPAVRRAVLDAGYTGVELDRRGYRQGSLNEALG